MRTASALMLLAFLVAMGAVPALSPTVCNDGCGEEEDEAGCVQCAYCASLTHPMLLSAPESPLVESAARHASPPVALPYRTEDRDVFHVPRHLV